MNPDTETTTTTETTTATKSHLCTWKGCPKPGPYKSEAALTMHTIRAHTHPWSTSDNFKGGRTSDTARSRWNHAYRDRLKEALRLGFNTWKEVPLKLQKEYRSKLQRKYNAAHRFRNVSKGLTAAGKPRVRPFPSHTIEYRKRKYREMLARNHARGLNAHGKPFKMARHKLRYVYPLPTTPTNKEVPTPEPPPVLAAPEPKWVHAQLHHCPGCGEDLTKWKKENK
jgi:hypothetical protein